MSRRKAASDVSLLSPASFGHRSTRSRLFCSNLCFHRVGVLSSANHPPIRSSTSIESSICCSLCYACFLSVTVHAFIISAREV